MKPPFRYIQCLIRVDEALLDCDFSHPAASIEEAIRAWEGCTVVRWDDITEDETP